MKKITLLIALFFCAISILNAQTDVVINSINGEDPNTFATNTATTPLTAGTVLTVNVTYTDVKDRAAGDNFEVKIFNNWDQLTVVTSDEANSASAVTKDFTITVPAINPGTDKGRLQVRGYNGSGWKIAAYTSPLMTIEAADVDTNAVVKLTTINGMSPADYHTSVGGALTEGDVITIGLDFTAIKADPNFEDALQVRATLLNEWSGIPEITQGVTTVTADDNSQSTTISLTIPNINATITDAVRIQVIGYGFNAGSDGYVYNTAPAPLYTIDHTTVLSTEKFNKNKLSAFYSSSNQSIILDADLTGDYTIYNILGQNVMQGKISSEINVRSLKKGLYILSTEFGSKKFVK